MHSPTETIGMLASLTSFVIGLPHAARIWKHRDNPEELRGIAMGSQVIGLTGTFLWSAYAILTAQVWVGAPHLVNGPITVATIAVLRRAGRTARSAAEPADSAEPGEELTMEDIDRLLEPVLLRLPDQSATERELVAA